MSTAENVDLVGDRTRNLAWYTHGVMPLLRRSPADTIERPPVTEESPAVGESTAELLALRTAVPAVPIVARPGAGRHRSSARVSLLRRVRRALARS